MTPLPWHPPLEYLQAVTSAHTEATLLYSGLQCEWTGQYSYLAYGKKHQISSNDFRELNSALSTNQESLSNTWFGYLGYELAHTLEILPTSAPSPITMPPLVLTQYHQIIRFDHHTNECVLFGDEPPPNPDHIKQHSSATKPVISITSNMSKDEYLQKVQIILDRIHRGDLYQANLTRKFYGTLTPNLNPTELFIKLCQVSPSPYSAYIKSGDHHILSSSPERFLHITANGLVDTRPIKGSAPRYPDPNDDQTSKDKLKHSAKDQAENLMIVDLMRNDLAKHCNEGSITVDGLFDITSYETIHHMSSTISGTKRDDASLLDLIKGCFPPGSMTGTPKIKAMETCNGIEQMDRGVYSGALGWFGGDGSVDLSVVIRTLLIHQNHFEFQVGGAIVADSDPESEWQETIVKATAIARCLELDPYKDLEI